MNDILNLPINKMQLCEFDCSCGNHHKFTVHDIAIGPDAINEIANIAKPFFDKEILVVFDNNTYEAAGKKTLEVLKNAGYKKIKELMFDTGSDILIPNEKTFGRIIQEISLDCSLVIGVGGGVINDSVKYVTSRAKLPFIIVATAPSMDGYVSDSAAIFSENKKLSVPAHLTYAVIGDNQVLQTAPDDLIQAGFGDVVGKITALADWDLAHHVNGDFRCDTCVSLVQNALDKCFDKADGLKSRDEMSLSALLEALTLTGVAMSLINITRPASGAEHMISHYWEMDFIARGENPNHHGIQVGVATPIVCKIFDEMKGEIPKSSYDLCWNYKDVEDLLRRVQAPVYPQEIGISKDLFYESLVNGYKVRPRYSILQFCKDKGVLEKIAEKITNDTYK